MEIFMSINSKETIKCPQCHQMSDMNVWHSITVSDSEDLKKDLLAGKVNMFCCPSCSYRALVPTPLLYHDEEKALMISFSPCTDAQTKKRLFEDVRATSKKSGELNHLQNYNLRFVYEYNSLLEKILIFDNGLNDKVTEVLKVLILMQKPESMDNMTAVFGKKEGDMLEFLIRDTKEGACYTSKVPMESYNTVKEQLRQSGVKDISFDWEIVDFDYGVSLLRGANNNL